MKKTFTFRILILSIPFLFALLPFLPITASAQTSFEIVPTFSGLFTSSVPYQNSTGHIEAVAVPTLCLLYRPHPSWGFELQFSGFNPTTHLDNPQDASAGVYTRSTIDMNRILAGLNYSLPFRKIRPFIGILAGYTHAATTENSFDVGKYTVFTWAVQTGIDFYLTPVIGLKLSGALITMPGIPNNSAFFGVSKSGDGFPTFAVGDPSTSAIRQSSISFGLSFRFGRKKKTN